MKIKNDGPLDMSHQGPVLLTWIQFNPSMNKLSHAQ